MNTIIYKILCIKSEVTMGERGSLTTEDLFASLNKVYLRSTINHLCNGLKIGFTFQYAQITKHLSV